MITSLKFLDPYSKSDAKYFFGRDNEIEKLYRKVKANPITLFYGLSGTGKTSIILCGLSNKFDASEWTPYVIRRGTGKTSILMALQCALMGIEIKSDSPPFTNSDALAILEDIYENNFSQIYLIFDQLEELFIYGNDDERKIFIKFLGTLKSEYRYIKVILVIREEYLASLDELEERIPEIYDSKVRLKPMENDKARQVITKIGLLSKLSITEDIAERIINRVTEKRGSYDTTGSIESGEKKIRLPYLQVYFHEIASELETKLTALPANELHLLTSDELPEIGKINDALSDFLEKRVTDAFEKLKDKNENLERETVWNVLNTLVSYKGTKQSKSIDEIYNLVS